MSALTRSVAAVSDGLDELPELDLLDLAGLPLKPGLPTLLTLFVPGSRAYSTGCEQGRYRSGVAATEYIHGACLRDKITSAA